MSWEEEFGIEISNRTVATLLTPMAAGDAIQHLLIVAGRPMDRAKIDAVIRSTTLEISGMSPEDYRVDGQFVQDFGLG